MDSRIFSGIYPGGIVYADRQREKGGDYARLAFLPFDTLELEFAVDCPQELADQISLDAERIQVRIGQDFRISTSGQTVVLGWAKCAPENNAPRRPGMRG